MEYLPNRIQEEFGFHQFQMMLYPNQEYGTRTLDWLVTVDSSSTSGTSGKSSTFRED